jgi:hypothetical protein
MTQTVRRIYRPRTQIGRAFWRDSGASTLNATELLKGALAPLLVVLECPGQPIKHFRRSLKERPRFRLIDLRYILAQVLREVP